MDHERNSLVPIGEVFCGPGGPVNTIFEASRQALHGFTRFDRADPFATGREEDPDLGFMVRLTVLYR